MEIMKVVFKTAVGIDIYKYHIGLVIIMFLIFMIKSHLN